MRPQGRQVAAAICLAAAVVCGIWGRISWRESGTPGVSVASLECVTADEIRRIREQENLREEPVDFTAWREEREMFVTTEDGYRSAQVTLIGLSGSSEYLPLGGCVLNGDDTKGCLIGEAVAERLFGSRAAEHLSVVCGDRTLTVRGVLRDAPEVVVFEEAGDAVFDRLAFSPHTAENACDAFLNRYGLGQMQPSRGGVAFRNLVPGKLSDFAGWKSNFSAERKRAQRRQGMPRSVFEQREAAQRRKGGILSAAGVLFLSAGMCCRKK